MKRFLSIILALTFLLSLFVLPSAAAEDPANGRTNVALGAELAGGKNSGGYWFKGVEGSNNIQEGGRTHINDGVHNDETLYLRLQVSATVEEIVEDLAFLYDVHGEYADEGKYYGILGYKFAEAATIDGFSIFLTQIIDGKPVHDFTLDGADIYVSETGEDGSWKLVYSETNILCEKKYKVYTDEDGIQTAYISADFDPVKAQYYRLCVTLPSCVHDDVEFEEEGNIAWFYITEVEFYEAKAGAATTTAAPETTTAAPETTTAAPETTTAAPDTTTAAPDTTTAAPDTTTAAPDTTTAAPDTTTAAPTQTPDTADILPIACVALMMAAAACLFLRKKFN
ncbi:MAG: hypothetical protein IJF49_02865 [Clostridia bacterium]|nr:hypothetical protein [Clostridia bacterium]